MLEAASKINVFLYDGKSKRAAHVNGERLILQSIIDCYHPRTRGLDGREIALRQGEALRSSMESKARLEMKRGISLNSGAEMIIHLQDDFKVFWNLLVRLQNHVSEQPFSTWLHDESRYIYGWEYLDFIRDTVNMDLKQICLQRTCGSWPRFTRDPDVKGIFLLGNSFGSLLKPVGSHCPGYECIPEGRDYLGLPVNILSALYSQRGFTGQQQRLTKEITWHRPNLLFEPCGSHGLAANGGRCECDRIQNFRFLGSKTFDPELIPPGTLVADGAVIFGESDRSSSTAIQSISRSSGTGGPQAHPLVPSSAISQPSAI